MSPFPALLDAHLRRHREISALCNPPRRLLQADCLRFREAILTRSGALATWGRSHATGRIPQDTYTVCHEADDSVDWTQTNNRPMKPEVFDALFHDALAALGGKNRLYITDRVVSAEARYALPVRTITDHALPALFSDTLFRSSPPDIGASVFHESGFTLLVLPHDRIDTAKYRGELRESGGRIIDYAVAMDFSRRAGIVYGTSYLGAVKKLIFTAMNHLLPERGVLPLHCSAVEDARGNTYLFLGLSGTGKTTLSSGPGLVLIGDDEHLWSDEGIANMEGGCYAKLIHLSQEKEPDIFQVVFSAASESRDRPIIENAMVTPDGTVDLDDARFTENSRAAYRLEALPRRKRDARGGHPSTILFLTADANGVLPPVAKLSLPQAMLWFLFGYTSKLAGTETGVVTPQATFSRFFGGAFMPRRSSEYLSLFQSLCSKHRPEIYLINTGWSGGPAFAPSGATAGRPYGTGKRMDIVMTRRIVDAALCGQLRDVAYREDKLFHLLVPQECPGVDPLVLDPRNTWNDPSAYDAAAKALAGEFSKKFDRFGQNEYTQALSAKCPGK